MFQWGMRKFLVTASAVGLCGLTLAMVAPSPASAAVPSVAVRVGVDSASIKSARAVATAVVAFRAEMNALLASYVANYGDRLSAAELASAKELIAKADSSLVGVQDATALTASLAAAKAPKARVLAAARAAEKAFTTSHDQALAALNQITPILQPKLGLFEAFGAKRDADAKLSKFSQVGVKITSLTKTINASQ